MNEEQLTKFVNLATSLSPENLSCDGELPRSQVRAKYSRLMKEWKKLEKEIGRSVTEEEVWGLYIEHKKTSVTK